VILALNWKMQLLPSQAGPWAERLAELSSNWPAGLELALFAPFTHLSALAAALRGSRVALGAQDLSAEQFGAHTGDVAAEMLADLGCSQVLVGHSERRSEHAESDRLIGRKLARARSAGLLPLLCLGEPWEVRQRGGQLEYSLAQLEAALEVAGEGPLRLAYEPVWAIGTGKSCHPEDAAQVSLALKRRLPGAAVLYGGSVNAANLAQFLRPELDGALVGGASLKLEQVAEMAALCG
jgi:triosephosphate isomerase